MQQAAANQVAAQQQAAHLQVEKFRLEVARRSAAAEGRPGESEVFNDERQGGRTEDGARLPRRSRESRRRSRRPEPKHVDRLV